MDNNLRVMAALFSWNTAQCVVIKEDLFLLAPRSHGSLKAQLTYNVIIGYDYSESQWWKAAEHDCYFCRRFLIPFCKKLIANPQFTFQN